MKRIFVAAASSLALVTATAPASAQEADEPNTARMVEIGETMAALFTSDPLTEEQKARVPAASAITAQMMPDGFYVEIMEDTMKSALEPMMAMLSGATGAKLMLGARLNVEPETIAGFSDEQKIELATLLDPGFAERGPMMQQMMNGMMRKLAVAIEPGFREGMAKAYAVRFDADQLADIASFFATPTGAIYARENMRLMADPQVMSASMKAMPAMMEQFAGMEEGIGVAMDALPPERNVSDLSDAERARMAALLGVDAQALENMVNPITQDSGGADDTSY